MEEKEALSLFEVFILNWFISFTVALFFSLAAYIVYNTLDKMNDYINGRD